VDIMNKGPFNTTIFPFITSVGTALVFSKIQPSVYEMNIAQNNPMNQETHSTSTKKRKRSDEDTIVNEDKSDLVAPKVKKPRRDPLEIDTVEGKKLKGQPFVAYDRKSKKEAQIKISSLADTLIHPEYDEVFFNNSSVRAYLADIVKTEQEEDFMDIVHNIEQTQQREPLIIRIKRELLPNQNEALIVYDFDQLRLSMK
jgi:hypothetical protein